jgi:hypothetical protein
LDTIIIPGRFDSYCLSSLAARFPPRHRARTSPPLVLSVKMVRGAISLCVRILEGCHGTERSRAATGTTVGRGSRLVQPGRRYCTIADVKGHRPLVCFLGEKVSRLKNGKNGHSRSLKLVTQPRTDSKNGSCQEALANWKANIGIVVFPHRLRP